MSARKKEQANAKRARTRKHILARRPETPRQRLDAEGAMGNDQVRRRLQWLAQEWNIPTNDVAEAMKCRVDLTVDFAEKYGVNLDWLLGGDLKGLQRMMRERRMGKPAPTPESLKEKFGRL